jgi:hypothetical protein
VQTLLLILCHTTELANLHAHPRQLIQKLAFGLADVLRALALRRMLS